MKFKISINLKISRIVKFFILTDFLLLTGWGMISPIFSVFIIQKVAGATLVTIGIGAAIYWIVKSIIQFPIARFLDKTDGERDDFYVLVAGLILAGITAFLFSLVAKPWQLYLVQLFQALAFGLYVPSWYSMFSRHLDKGSYAFEWSLDSAGVGIASGFAGIIGGVIANALGFQAVFILAGIFSLIAALVIVAAPNLIFPARSRKPEVPKNHGPLSVKS